MNKLIFAITAFAFCLGISSCNQDLLDIPQKGVVDLETTIKNATDEDAIALVGNLYRTCYHDILMVFNAVPENCLGDDMWNSYGADIVNFLVLDNFSFTSEATIVRQLYEARYVLIYNCNLIITKMNDNTEVKRRVIAEAKAIRAWCYIDLIRYYGTPPIVERVITSNDALDLTNGDPKALWRFVETDLTDAMKVIPSKSNVNGQRAIGGRITHEACQALLGKAQISQKNYIAAAQTLKALIDTKLYDLVDIENLWRPAADFGPEYLWEHNVNDANLTNFGSQMFGYEDNSYGWDPTILVPPDKYYQGGACFMNPTKSFGDFLMGYDRDATGERSKRSRLLIATWDDLFSGKDLNGDPYYATPPTKNGDLLKKGGQLYQCAGYFRLRRNPLKEDLFPSLLGGGMPVLKTNRPYIRYAEVLLLYAEAQAINGDDGSGLAALNQVRTRAGMIGLSAYTLTDVKNEKRAEMFNERERFHDLIRWDDAKTLLKDKCKTVYYFHGYKKGSKEWDVREETPVGASGYGFKEKNHILPFPNTEIYSTNIKQNNGY